MGLLEVDRDHKCRYQCCGSPGIWDEKYEALKEVVAVWGILPKGVMELKNRVLEDKAANITRSRKHYKPSFLEKDHPGRDLGEESKPTEPKEEKEKEEGY